MRYRFVGLLKDAMFAPSLHTDILDRNRRISEAGAPVTRDSTLVNIWGELEFRIAVCHLSHGAHIGCLWRDSV
jgi:hypothetical protein